MSASQEFLPRLKVVAAEMLKSLERFPASPYTKDTVQNLDHILCLIDRIEGIESELIVSSQDVAETEEVRDD